MDHRAPQPSFQTVRGRLILLIAALSAPGLAIISLLSRESYLSQRTAVRAEVTNTARAVAGLVDTEIARSQAMLQMFAATRSLRDSDWETLDATARRALPEPNRWLVVVDMAGHQIINTRVPRGVRIPDIELDAGYVEAMQAGRSYTSDLVYGPAAQQFVIHIDQPVRVASGRLYGISVVMLPDTLRAALDVRRFSPDGVVTILDRQGRIIVRNPHQDSFIGGLATSDIVKVTRENVEGVGESVTLEGIPVLTAFSRAKCGWSVAIGTPKTKVFVATQRLFALGFASMLAVALAGIAIAVWIARAVVRGVDGLARDAERLTRGEPAAALPSHLQEIHTVADAMRRMAATKNETEAQLREARDRLREYAQQLEKKVEERTASLRDAVAQMEEFSYTVSHDLRAPLRAMNGYATALMEDYGPALAPDAQEYLQRIIRASDRMNRLTSDLLDYSRIARADVPRSRVSLEMLLRAAMDQYGELSPGAADVRIVTPLHDVWAHETSLSQALTNLLTNAAKFVRPGERPRITVRTERRGERVRVWVEDNGIGIPRQYQDRLFRIFERAAGNDYEGTGVGLAIVRKVVEKVGGACGVESDGKSGSRFWIELPAAPADSPR